MGHKRKKEERTMKRIEKMLMTSALCGLMVFSFGLRVSASETAPVAVPVSVNETVDLSALFDAEYYLKANPDLAAVYANDAEALYAHFLRNGANDGRVCSPLFDVIRYKEKYPDLVAIYGDNNLKYYEEYLTEGIRQGRNGEGIFDAVAYANAYPDLKSAFGYDLKALYNHFITTGIYEGRLEGMNFNYWCYGALNPELGKSYSEHPEQLFLQYVNEGLAQGLEGAYTDAKYRDIYCDPDGYGGKDPKHLIRKWTVAQMPENGEKGYDEAYCEVCGQHFRDEMSMNDYYVRHLHMPDSDLNWRK